MFETTVIDEFLTKKTQIDLHDMIMHHANWKFLKDVSGNENQQYPSHGFVHVLNHPEKALYSDLCSPIHSMFKDNFDEILSDQKHIYYSRIFLQLPLASSYIKEHNGVHVDLPAHISHVACVYYVNGSDGDTIIYDQTINDTPGGSQNVVLKEHKRVTPKAGRAVLFDGSRYHCSSQPTINYRTIINFDLTV
jgi:hypothetical protein